jgi:hypothetical protein
VNLAGGDVERDRCRTEPGRGRSGRHLPDRHGQLEGAGGRHLPNVSVPTEWRFIAVWPLARAAPRDCS